MQNILITNREGELEPVNVKKIQKKTYKSCYGLPGTDSLELELDAKLEMFSGIKSEDIQKTLVLTAVNKIDIDKPNWTFAAARLFIEDLYHKVGKVLEGNKGNPYAHLKLYLEYGSSDAGARLNRSFYKKYTIEEIEELNNIIQSGIKNINGDKYHERDYQFTYLGIKTFYDRYALKDINGNLFELPQHMFMGIAMFLAQNEKDRLKWAKNFYNMISTFEVMLATPTLSNARTERNQLSSCYVGSTPDNIEGIFDSYKDMSLLSKYGGGIGWDWNDIRSNGGNIDNNKGVAGGTVPWLKITNDLAIAVDQLGTRKGSIAVYLEPWHMDIKDFLDLKKNSGEERRRAHDLFPALWIPDLFMQRAINNEKWTLFDPAETQYLHELFGKEFEAAYIEAEKNDNLRKEVINAKDLWKIILTSYFESGSPFLTFKDNANYRNQNPHIGVIKSSNLCTEIFQVTDSATYGIELEMKSGERFRFEEHEKINVIESIDINEVCKTYKKPAKKVNSVDKIVLNGNIYEVVFSSRIVLKEGKTAVCNLASVNLSKVNSKKDFEKTIPIAVRALDNVIDMNYYPIKSARNTNQESRAIGLGVMGEAQMLAEKGIQYGSQEHFEFIDGIMEEFSYNTIKASADLSIERGAYKAFEGSNWSKGILPIDSWNKKAEKITSYTMRKDWDSLREQIKKHGIRNGYLMAIAPTSTISILTGTSQAIESIYKRKWFEENLSGLIPVTAPNLNLDTWNNYQPVYDLDQIKIIKAAAVRQKWLDQGQSLNVFIRLDLASGKYLNDIYTSAWKLGLKSTYYLRSQSPEVAEEADIEDRSIECSGCQ